VSGVEILDRFQNQTLRLDGATEIKQLLKRPQLVRVTGESPTGIRSSWLIVATAVCTSLKIIHEMRDDMSSTSLACELKILARQHMPI
jgi:hypothetical protein